MASVQIPNLPAAIALSGTEQVEGVQGGTSVRMTTGQIASLSGVRSDVLPVSGTWLTGAFVFNSAPTVVTGKILLGWSCTEGGTPGTWEPCYVTNT